MTQQLFQKYLTDQIGDITRYIIGEELADAKTRLAVYHHAYRTRLIDVLAVNYPKLNEILGTEIFHDLSEQYLYHHPSNFKSARWFGDKLPFYLRTIPPYSKEPYWAELAKLEWTMTLAFDAADCQALTENSLLSLTAEEWPNLTFKKHPSVYMLEMNYDICTFWQNKFIPDLEPQTQQILVWRQDFQAYFTKLSSDEASALRSALQGKTFSDICEALLEWHNEDDAAIQAACYLRKWVHAQLFVI